MSGGQSKALGAGSFIEPRSGGLLESKPFGNFICQEPRKQVAALKGEVYVLDKELPTRGSIS